MGTAVANVNEQRGVMSIDLSKVNYANALKTIEKFQNSVGGSSGTASNFPGTQHGFKKGVYSAGFGDKARRLKDPSFVVNAPNAMATWMTWAENDAGKKRPVYAGIKFPALGDDPVSRESLGQTDESEWELDDNNKPQDPWKPVLVMPIRDEDGEEINHLFLATKSSVIAGFRLFATIMEEMKTHAGELPIVSFGSDVVEQKIKTGKKDKKGNELTKTNSYHVPVFEITGWVKAEDYDNPAKGGVKVTSSVSDEDDGDMGEVKTSSRKAVTKKEEPKQIAKGKTSRKQALVDDDTL